MKRHPAYKTGFNDGLKYALEIIEKCNEYHKGVALCATKTIKKEMKK